MRVYVIGGDAASSWSAGLTSAGHDLEQLPGPDDVDLADVRPDPKWRHAAAGRTISRSELARAAAHHAAWERIAVDERPALVTESGAELPAPVPEPAGLDYLLVAGPEPALAYLVTPAGASRLLVTAPLRRLVPITEEGPGVLYTDHLHVLSVGAPGADGEPDESRALVSAAARGVPIEPVEWLADGLVDLADDDLVLAVPSTALVNASAGALLETYARLDAEVVLSLDEEAVMGPAGALRTLLAAGSEAGAEGDGDGAAEPVEPVEAAEARAGTPPDPDDPPDYVAIDLGLDAPAVDTGAELFAVLGPGVDTVLALNGRLLNPVAGTEPLVVTATEPRLLDDLVAELAAPATRDLVRVLRYDDARPDDAGPPSASVVAPDIVQVPLWTPEFCATVIRASEAVGRWGSDPDDPFPGRELSLAAISPQLHRALEEHIAALVWPALREHWPSIDFDGLQDAFVIKYTARDETGLRPHHDLAQVSAAVRLNDGYEGGRLEFPRQGFTNESTPVGAAVVWPSLVTHPHHAAPVTRGVKYALTIWCRIPGQSA